MTFAALRQHVLEACTLSTDFFGEDVEFTGGGQPRSLRVKIQHEQESPRRRQEGSLGPSQGTLDELERIEVCVHRSAEWEHGGLAAKPNIGDTLLRSASRDQDRRPFVFGGEVKFEGDLHAVYVFQRPRRVVQGRKA